MTIQLKPCCPVCGDTVGVRTIGGGSIGTYRYYCIICQDQGLPYKWQQKPPHKRSAKERPQIKMITDPPKCPLCLLKLTRCKCDTSVTDSLMMSADGEGLKNIELQPISNTTDDLGLPPIQSIRTV